LAIGVLTRRKLFFYKLTGKPNTATKVLIVGFSIAWRAFNTFDVCANECVEPFIPLSGGMRINKTTSVRRI
jgi:hypothetical protein